MFMPRCAVIVKLPSTAEPLGPRAMTSKVPDPLYGTSVSVSPTFAPGGGAATAPRCPLVSASARPAFGGGGPVYLDGTGA